VKPTCSIDGCEKPVLAREWCSMHYCRWKRNGDPLVTLIAPKGTPVEVRLAMYSEPQGDCLVWTGDRRGNGYGRIEVDGRSEGVHILAWTLAHGPVPDGLYVCHTCDNPPCFLDDLFLGTPKDNAQDMIRKGRRCKLVGANHPRATFNDAEFAEVRELAAQGMKYPEIAALFCTSRSSVWRAVNGLTQHALAQAS
jgi:hypothetical protein